MWRDFSKEECVRGKADCPVVRLSNLGWGWGGVKSRLPGTGAPEAWVTGGRKDFTQAFMYAGILPLA